MLEFVIHGNRCIYGLTDFWGAFKIGFCMASCSYILCIIICRYICMY